MTERILKLYMARPALTTGQIAKIIGCKVRDVNISIRDFKASFKPVTLKRERQ